MFFCKPFIAFSFLFFFLLGGCATLEVAREVQSGRRAMQLGNSQAALGHFESAAQGNPDYITDFTLLDIALVPRFLRMESFGVLPATSLSRLGAWLQRMKERPSVKTNM